jgi:hypothetical protein
MHITLINGNIRLKFEIVFFDFEIDFIDFEIDFIDFESTFFVLNMKDAICFKVRHLIIYLELKLSAYNSYL